MQKSAADSDALAHPAGQFIWVLKFETIETDQAEKLLCPGRRLSLVEAAHLRQSLIRLFPRARRARVEKASRDITLKVSAWLGGQALLGTIIGVTTAIGLGLLGIPFFYVLALIAGIGELIPVVGPNERWSLVDRDRAAVPLGGTGTWPLLAISGGHPIDVAGEWDGRVVRPLFASAWTERITWSRPAT